MIMFRSVHESAKTMQRALEEGIVGGLLGALEQQQQGQQQAQNLENQFLLEDVQRQRALPGQIAAEERQVQREQRRFERDQRATERRDQQKRNFQDKQNSADRKSREGIARLLESGRNSRAKSKALADARKAQRNLEKAPFDTAQDLQGLINSVNTNVRNLLQAYGTITGPANPDDLPARAKTVYDNFIKQLNSYQQAEPDLREQALQRAGVQQPQQNTNGSSVQQFLQSISGGQ